LRVTQYSIIQASICPVEWRMAEFIYVDFRMTDGYFNTTSSAFD